eukprot:317034-Prymnesium_polylepis.1
MVAPAAMGRRFMSMRPQAHVGGYASEMLGHVARMESVELSADFLEARDAGAEPDGTSTYLQMTVYSSGAGGFE